MSRVIVALLCFFVGALLLVGSPPLYSQPPKNQIKPPAKQPDLKAKQPEPKPKVPTPAPKLPTPKPPEPESPLPPAEEPAGLPSPLRLVQGLREKGLTDLALQLLDTLDPKSPEASSYPLEKAKCKLVLANEAEELPAKMTLLAEARSLLDGFIKANKTHPRLAEARLSLAQLTSLEAKNRLQRANRAKEESEAKAERVEARKMFVRASQEYAEAAREMANLLASMPDSLTKRSLQRDKVQAELDSAINLFNLYMTFGDRDDLTAAQLQERSRTLDQARAAFEALTNGPFNSPIVWIAKAWMVEIDTMQDRPEAKAGADEINRAATGAAEAGRRLLNYFNVRRAFRSANTPQDIANLQTLARNWLVRYDNPRKPTDESHHVKYMLGLSLEGEVRSSMGARIAKSPKQPKFVDPTNTERTKLREAERLFREVASSDNDYADRAMEHRMTVVRLLIGETIKPAKEYAKFEDVHMAALVQQSKLRDKKDEKELKEGREVLISLLERARQLATPQDSPADVLNDQITLAVMYLLTGRPQQAAVLAEYLARQPRTIAARAAKAGEIAVIAYLNSSTQIPESEDAAAARKADQDRALRIGEFTEQTYPAEPSADAIRYRLGVLSYSLGKPVVAFDYLSRIQPGFANLKDARQLEGVIAHQLLVPADSPLPENRRLSVFQKAVADLEQVEPPATDASSEEVIEHIRLRIRLCLLYLIHQRIEPPKNSYDKAESVARNILDELDKYKSLTPEHRLEAQLLAGDLKTRSIYLQGVELLKEDRVDDVISKLEPLLAEIDQSGPAVAIELNGQPLEGNLAKLASSYDADRRDAVLLALKAYIRKVKIDEAKAQLSRLEKLGGSIDSNISTLSQLVNEVRAQILKLRKEKPEEAKALTEGLTQLITQITSGEVKPPVRIFAGQALLAVDRYQEAAAELAKVPTAEPADLARRTSEFNEMIAKAEAAAATSNSAKKELEDLKQRLEAVRFHKAAALYRMRALRQAKLYKEADALAAEVVGTEEKKGWGYDNTEYRKEVLLLAEAKAQDSTGKAASAFWGQAVTGWANLARTQQARLRFIQNKFFEAKKASDASPDDAALLAAFNQVKAEVERNKALYFEYYFETSRASILAYINVYKSDPAKIKAKLESEAQKMVTLEFQNPDLAQEVRAKYIEFLEEDNMKELRAAYEAAHATYTAECRAKLSPTLASLSQTEKMLAKAEADLKNAEDARDAMPTDPKLQEAVRMALGEVQRLKSEVERLRTEEERLKTFLANGKMFIKKAEPATAALNRP